MPFTQSTWRLLITPQANGAWNMAVDEAILKEVARGEVYPTLRLYSWEPACLSLGYAQPSTDVDFDRLNARGWHIVRRPTGGRAILHTDEITYAVIAPHTEPRIAGGVLESYRVISKALLMALNLVGLPAVSTSHSQTQPGYDPSDPICFEVPSNFEITVMGKKLIGSAQARKKEGVIQHGTLPLYGDLARIIQVLTFKDEAERLRAGERLLSRAITVESVLERVISWDRIAQAFIDGFKETLNLSFIPSELSMDERTLTKELVSEKYANDEWTNKI
jgi:lipoate-protein ligase A